MEDVRSRVCPLQTYGEAAGVSFRSEVHLIFSEKLKQEDVHPVSFPLKGTNVELNTAAPAAGRTMILKKAVQRIADCWDRYDRLDLGA